MDGNGIWHGHYWISGSSDSSSESCGKRLSLKNADRGMGTVAFRIIHRNGPGAILSSKTNAFAQQDWDFVNDDSECLHHQSFRFVRWRSGELPVYTVCLDRSQKRELRPIRAAQHVSPCVHEQPFRLIYDDSYPLEFWKHATLQTMVGAAPRVLLPRVRNTASLGRSRIQHPRRRNAKPWRTNPWSAA